jgi:ABC-type glycerol-3-phosphate transport system permease component
MADRSLELNPTIPTVATRQDDIWPWRKLINKTVLYTILIGASLIAIIPFLWMISTSLMTLGETINRQWLPATPQWDNYTRAWRDAQFGNYFMNSVIITAVTIAGLLFTSIFAAYAFARIKFFGRGLMFTLILSTLMIPESVVMIPNFLIVTGRILPLPQLHPEMPFISFGGSWMNTLAALSIPFMANAFSIFLLRQFFAQIPEDLWDAARIDGSGHLRFLLQIVLPISKSALLTVTLLTFIAAWNAFLWPLIVTTRDTWRPLMVGLYNFVQEGGTQTHLMMAGSFITIIPTLILYFLTQKTFTEGIATTGLKG